ncbi:MAG: hypothetical protein ACYTF6_06650 [Planctomycetota bacterium]|jgi:hypothetical protein
MQDWKEALGFLCRWCLLALAFVTVVLVALASIMASASAAAGLAAEMIVPDAVWGRKEGVHLTGFATPEVARRYPQVAISSSPDSQLLLVPTSGEKISPQLSGCQVGLNHIRTIGVPYSRHSFNKADAMLHVVPPGREVCLLDAATVLDGRANDPEGLADCLSELLKDADVVFFHEGPLEQFPHVRKRLRESYPRIGIVFFADRQLTPKTLSRMARTLAARKSESRKPVVITGDAQLANTAAAKGYPVHLLAAVATKVGRDGNPRVHESFAKFKEYLDVEPIRH